MNDDQAPAQGTLVQRPERFFTRRWILVLGIAVVVGGILLVVRSQQSKLPTPPGGAGRNGQNGPVAVAVAVATAGDIQVRIPALGTITPLASVTVRTQISGQLQKIGFTEGQLIRQGDFVAQIDPRPYEAALQQIRGTLRRDRALLDDAKLNLQRYEGMIREDAIAQQQVDTQRALVDQYAGAVEADLAQERTAELNLQYTHITSPVNGRVGLRQVDQGNYVTPGDTSGIVVINQLEPITALFAIPEDHVTALMPRLHSGEVLEVEAWDRANKTRIATGRLLTIDNQIDTSTGTIKLRAQFDNHDGVLFPNQFVNIQLLQETLHDQISIPNAAVHQGSPNGVLTSFVYLVNPDSTVTVRPVTTGVVDGERVAVKGLAAGDQVVTEGGDRLRDGAKVLLPAATPAHAPADAAVRKDGGRRHGKPAPP